MTGAKPESIVESETGVKGNTTVSELIDEFGVEVVKRGLSYMQNMEKADREFRQSANPDDLDEGWSEGYGIDGVETDASEEWADKMKEKGLGLDS